MTTIAERTPQRMTLLSGATTLSFDKGLGTATLRRKLLFWSLKPQELPLTDVAQISVDAGIDRASGVDVCNVMVVARSGAAWAFSASDKKDAEETAVAI